MAVEVEYYEILEQQGETCDYFPEDLKLRWETNPLIDGFPLFPQHGSSTKPPEQPEESSFEGEPPHKEKPSLRIQVKIDDVHIDNFYLS